MNPYLITIPVFNDWESLHFLILDIDKQFYNEVVDIEILVIDDASTLEPEGNFNPPDLKAIRKIDILKLRRNVGHQRAITIALSYISSYINCQAVIVMDADGEDAPEDVIRLIRKCEEEEQKKVVFAQRVKRSEKLTFKIFYFIYKQLFKLLTGREISFGNFSIIPYRLLSRVVVVSEIWNNYAAGLLKARIPYTQIPCKRSTRISGESRMNFTSLVMHGLSAISVYIDVVSVRALTATVMLMFFSTALIIIVMLVRLLLPDWLPYVAGISFIILLQSLGISLFFIFLILSERNNLRFLPIRDYNHFILEVKNLFENKL